MSLLVVPRSIRRTPRPARSCRGAVALVLGVALVVVGCGRRHAPSLEVTVPPGLRLEEVATLLGRAGAGDASVLLGRARDPAFARALGLPSPTLEGYIGAGVHRLPTSAGVDTVLAVLVSAQRARLDPALMQRARGRGLDELSLLTLASLAEADARSPDELPTLAAIYAARAARRWHLDSEASLRFALARGPKAPVAASERATDNPYNTFRTRGLPPGPIASPSQAAIRAVLDAPAAVELVPLHDASGRLRFDLAPDERDALAALPPDPTPTAIVRNTHYVVSNERQHEHLRGAVDHAGGALVGVGAEQSYLLAGWSRPELVVLVDFDEVIPLLHGAYRVALREAKGPQELLELWSKRGSKRLEAALGAAYSGPELKQIRRAFRATRTRVSEHLARLAAHYREIGVPCFLTDDEQYAHLRALALHDRLFRVRGDLTGPRTLERLGEVLTRARRVVRVLYLSNAEQYFAFTSRYRRNLLGLPSDAVSVVLRTRPTGRDYTYVVQAFERLRPWLEDESVRGVDALAPRRLLSPQRPLLELSSSPPGMRGAPASVVR